MYSYQTKNRSRWLQASVLLGATIMLVMMGMVGFLLLRELLWEGEPAGEGSIQVAERISPNVPSLLTQSTATPTPTDIPPTEARPMEGTGNATSKPFSALATKDVVAGSSKNRPRWTATPLPTNTPTPTPSPVPTFVGQNSSTGLIRPDSVNAGEKWIDVNLTTQTLVAFEGNAPVFQSLVSTGTAQHPTVTGQFRIWLRFTAQDMNGYRLGYDYFLKNVPYVQYFYQDYSLHGTYWHNNFGTPMSHGCVNLPTPSAEWLFNWAAYGTLVNIHT